jgi:hypothetical protein
VRIATRIDDSWKSFQSVSAKDVAFFPDKNMSVIRFQEDSGRMLVGGGTAMSALKFTHIGCPPVTEICLESGRYRRGQPRVSQNGWIGRSPTDAITGLAPLEGTGTFIASHLSGLLQKCKVDQAGGKNNIRSLSRYSHPKQIIQAIDASSSGLFASITSQRDSTISLYHHARPWQESFTWNISSKAWTVKLDQSKSPAWLALGHSGLMPFSIYTLGQDGLPTETADPAHLLGNDSSTSVYGIATPPLNSPIGGSSNTIVSAWYDGTVRIHDLRRARKQPILELVDPLGDAPLYSVACGGGAGCTVAAGTARHSLVRLWDIRFAQKDKSSGLSVFGPGKDNSPVYSLFMEHDRLFAATDRRIFMLEFGQLGERYNQQGPDAGYRRQTTQRHGYHASQAIVSRNPELWYYRHADMHLRQAI